MEFVEFKGKTLDEALMQASVELGCASTDLEYNVVSEGSTGFLGLIGSKPFVIIHGAAALQMLCFLIGR